MFPLKNINAVNLFNMFFLSGKKEKSLKILK